MASAARRVLTIGVFALIESRRGAAAVAVAPLGLFIAGRLAVAQGVRVRPVEAPPSPLHAETGEAIDTTAFAAADPDVREACGVATHASLDWAISEAVNELHPMKVPPPVVAPRLPVADRSHRNASERSRQPKSERRWRPPDDLQWIYGSHHKAGTALILELGKDHANVMGKQQAICWVKSALRGDVPEGCSGSGRRDEMRIWLWSRLSKQILSEFEHDQVDWSDPYHINSRASLNETQISDEPPRSNLRGVHIIRDPIAMAISGYIYHLKSPEVPMLRPIVNMSMADGLALVVLYTVHISGKEMVDAYSSAPSWVMNIRYESFAQSSESFDQTAAAMYEHMLGDIYTPEERQKLLQAAAKHDLRRHRPYDGDHVADPSLKEKVSKMLQSIPPGPLRALQKMRKSMGY